MGYMSRRSFFHMGALATAAAATGGRGVSANDKIRFGVIGVRNRGNQMVDYFVGSGQFEFAAMADCDTAMFDTARKKISRRANEANPDEHQDFRELLDRKDIDAVVIASPDHWHAAMHNMALDAGKHVMVEKPASYNIADGAAMVEAAKAHPNLVSCVGTQQRSGRHFERAKEFIAEGGIGKVGFVRCWVAQTRGFIPFVEDTPPPETMDYGLWLGPAAYEPYNPERVHYNWRFMKAWGTGEMGNWGAHWLDIARWYCGLDLPSSVAGFGGQFVVDDAKEWPDTQTVLYEFPQLTLLWEQRLWTDKDINQSKVGVEFGGDKGTVVATRNWWRVFPRDGEMEEHPGGPLDIPHARNFADAIRGEAKPSAPIDEGHKTSVLCHLGNIAVERQNRLEFDAEALRFTNDDAANAMLAREYREPWTL